MNDYTLLTDDQWVSLYVSGQDNAFDVLLERYKNRLYNYILYIVHKEDTADDLFQETFVKAWKGRGSFRGSITISSPT